MLKQYVWRGATWQFEEGAQPEGAVEVTAVASGGAAGKAAGKAKAEKAAAGEADDVKVYKPANKARRTAKK